MNRKVNFDAYFFASIYISPFLYYLFYIDEILGDSEKDKKDVGKYDSEEEIWENMEEVKPKKRKTKHL